MLSLRVQVQEGTEHFLLSIVIIASFVFSWVSEMKYEEPLALLAQITRFTWLKFSISRLFQLWHHFRAGNAFAFAQSPLTSLKRLLASTFGPGSSKISTDFETILA